MKASLTDIRHTASGVRHLPLDCAFLRRVYLGFGRAAAEEEGFHVVEEEGLRVLVHEVEAVVVDNHVRPLDPLLPAAPAYLRAYALPQLVREGREAYTLARLPAARALNLFRHRKLSLNYSCARKHNTEKG